MTAPITTEGLAWTQPPPMTVTCDVCGKVRSLDLTVHFADGIVCDICLDHAEEQEWDCAD